MYRILGVVEVLLSFAAVVFCQSIPSELLSKPALLELDKPTLEVKVGSTLNYTVVLKNAQRNPTKASSDIQLEVQAPTGTEIIRIPAGQSSATFTWTAKTSGIAQMIVRSGNLRPAVGLVLVTPSNQTTGSGVHLSGREQSPSPTPESSEESRRTAESATGLREKGDPSSTGSQESRYVRRQVAGTAYSPAPVRRIALHVTPLPVFGDAISNVWKANVTVEILEADTLVPASNDIQVDLHANSGHFSAPTIIIRGGEYSNFNNAVLLTANRAGADRVSALSTLGPASPLDVEYLLPVPVRLRISLGTPVISGTGSSNVTATVCLLDDAENLTYFSNQDVLVTLVAGGQLSSPRATILNGKSCSDPIAWTSSSGTASITAEAGGLKSDSKNILFPAFPWYLVWLAAIGGVLGALVAKPSDFSFRWLAHTWRGLAFGARLGAIFFLFARYGAIVLPKASPVSLEKIPVVSRLGALLLGFVGGLYGRKLWKIQEHESGSSQRGKTVVATRGASG